MKCFTLPVRPQQCNSYFCKCITYIFSAQTKTTSEVVNAAFHSKRRQPRLVFKLFLSKEKRIFHRYSTHFLSHHSGLSHEDCPGPSGRDMTGVTRSAKPTNQKSATPCFLSRMARILQQLGGCWRTHTNPLAQPLIALFTQTSSYLFRQLKPHWYQKAFQDQ